MSYDLFVHSPQQPPIDIIRLTERMRVLGWEIRVLDDSYGTPSILSTGPVPDDGMVFGWDLTSPDAQRCDALFPIGGTVDLNRLPDDLLSLDGSELSYELHPTPEEEMDPDDWTEMMKDLPSDKQDIIRKAAIRYYLRTSAHLNLFRFIFQGDLCLAVAQACDGLIEDPQEGTYRWARDVTPASHTPMERAVAEYDAMFPKPWWRKALDHLAGNDDQLRPDGVNNLLWLVFLESALRVFRLGLGLHFQRYFSPFLLLTALLFLAIGFGLLRGHRWSWSTMFIAYPLAVGVDVLMSLSNGFGLNDGLRLGMIALAVAYLLSKKVREHFGV